MRQFLAQPGARRALAWLPLLLLVGCTGSIVGDADNGAAGAGGEQGESDGGAAGAGGGAATGGAGGSGGEAGGTAGGGSGGAYVPFTCDAQQHPTDLPLRRLSRTQIVNVVAEVIARSGLAAADRTAVQNVVTGLFAAVPDDRVVGPLGETHGGFTRMDQAIQQGSVDGMYFAGVALGAELTATTARRTAVFGACATDTSTTNDAQCLRDFVTRFGRLVHRRPLTAEDVTFYTGVAGATPVAAAALSDVVGVMLTSPHFLYHVEQVDPAGAATPLDAYELANRLSFHFWNTMPDDELLGAAADGGVLADATYNAQVERLFSDPRANRATEDFFREWWRLDELPPLNTRIGTPVFDAFAGTDVPTATLHEDMKAEVLAMAREVTRSSSPMSELLKSRRFFAASPALARLYQQPAWDGGSSEFEQPLRTGLLTRAAFLASGSANTRPVMKGFRVLNALLCTNLPPPPGAVATPLDLSPDLTTREVVERITESSTSCSGCHRTINPLGFVTENFDALGRQRTAQRLFSDTGMLTGEKPVSTAVTSTVAGRAVPLDRASQLQDLMLEGGFQTCFARQYFRFTFQRTESETQDGCTLRALQDKALEGQPVAEVLKSIALRPEFKMRDVP